MKKGQDYVQSRMKELCQHGRSKDLWEVGRVECECQDLVLGVGHRVKIVMWTSL